MFWILVLVCCLAGIEFGECATVGKVYDGDILMNKKEVKSMQKQIAATGGVKLNIWPGGIVPYEISREFGKCSMNMLETK